LNLTKTDNLSDINIPQIKNKADTSTNSKTDKNIEDSNIGFNLNVKKVYLLLISLLFSNCIV